MVVFIFLLIYVCGVFIFLCGVFVVMTFYTFWQKNIYLSGVIMAREKSYSEQLTEKYEQDWFDELNYKRTGHRNDAARELEKLLREIERMTRPKNIYYKAKKKKKAKIYGLTGR